MCASGTNCSLEKGLRDRRTPHYRLRVHQQLSNWCVWVSAINHETSWTRLARTIAQTSKGTQPPPWLTHIPDDWWLTLVYTVFHLPVVFTVSPSQNHSQTITSSATLGQYLSQIHFSNWFFKLRGEIWSWNLFMPKQMSLRNDWLTEKWTYL